MIYIREWQTTKESASMQHFPIKGLVQIRNAKCKSRDTLLLIRAGGTSSCCLLSATTHCFGFTAVCASVVNFPLWCNQMESIILCIVNVSRSFKVLCFVEELFSVYLLLGAEGL